jgi:hypothetical protein
MNLIGLISPIGPIGPITLTAAVLLHQIDRAVGKLKKMWVCAIAVGQNCKTELALAIAEQKSSIAGNAAAVRDVAIAVTDLRPPRQSKSTPPALRLRPLRRLKRSFRQKRFI